MSFIYSEVRLYKRLGDKEGDWNSEYSIISDTFAKNIKIGNGTKKDTFKFNLLNNYNKYYVSGNIIEQGDKIEIYQKKNSKLVTSDDLLMDGIIKKITNDNSGSHLLTIEGANRTEELLNGLTFISVPITGASPAEIIEKSLDFHNGNNENFRITWDGNNKSTKDDGSPFPTYLVETFYQPMYVTFEKYSSATYTKDGNYFYNITKDNTLVWKKMSLIPEYFLNQNDCKTYKFYDADEHIINSLIINCGRTPDNKPIRTYKYDYSSRAEVGAKWKYYTLSNTIADDLVQQETNENPSSFESGTSRFPKSTSYPYTTLYGDTVANDGEWNDSIRNEAVKKGKAEGLSFLTLNAQKQLKIDVTVEFDTIYVVNSIISCTFPTNGLSNKSMRITDIQYTDYETKLTLLEDIQ